VHWTGRGADLPGGSESVRWCMTDRTTIQLQLVAEINRLLSEAQIPHWLFGGWSVDFHAGLSHASTTTWSSSSGNATVIVPVSS
jgi:hypothetical protein